MNDNLDITINENKKKNLGFLVLQKLHDEMVHGFEGLNFLLEVAFFLTHLPQRMFSLQHSI